MQMNSISRKELQELKGENDIKIQRESEKKREEYVKRVVDMIYSEAIKHAKNEETSTDGLFCFDLPNYYYQAVDNWAVKAHRQRMVEEYDNAPLEVFGKEFKLKPYAPSLPPELKDPPADPYMLNGTPTQTMKDIISKLKLVFPDCFHNYGWKQDAKQRWIYYIIIKWS